MSIVQCRRPILECTVEWLTLLLLLLQLLDHYFPRAARQFARQQRLAPSQSLRERVVALDCDGVDSDRMDVWDPRGQLCDEQRQR